MNLNDVIAFSYLIKTHDDKQVIDEREYILGYAYVRHFIDFYYVHLGLTDVNIAKDYNKSGKNPNPTFDGFSLERYDDGEIILKRLSVVLQGKKVMGK